MYIKSLVLDGFKSYAQRTEITGFDNKFNAITGLNGSGKSNILDAICFVLGISNLSHVRAANLQDLVYKSGQAGVTKATVSIVFDNLDKLNSPMGYENFDEITITRQIVVGGKNKYLINGITATNTRVTDLFRSVQLNVNNPHFLIMQGRITKVLNMKPPEILSLLEEAASTKNYESKREMTLATIAKKDNKLHEIDSLLTEDINPKLNKLRLEMTNYKEYQKVVRELEYLNKFIIAAEYSSLQKIVDDFEGEMSQAKHKTASEEQNIANSDIEKKNKEKNIEKLLEEKQTSYQPVVEQMELHLDDMKRDLALLHNGQKRAIEAAKVSVENVKQLEERLAKEETAVGRVRAQMAALQTQYDSLGERANAAKAVLARAERRQLDVGMGLYVAGDQEAGDEGAAAASLSEAVRLANKALSSLEMTKTSLEMKLTHHEKERAILAQQVAQTSGRGDSATLQKRHDSLRQQLIKTEAEIATTGYSETEEATLNRQVDTHRQQMHSANRDLEEAASMTDPRLHFQYRKPPQHVPFDESGIVGVVASLVRLRDDSFSTAMEVVAGNKLYNVVVEDDALVATLFNHKCLERKTTLLPLNKMRPFSVPDHKLEAAQSLVGANAVWHPLRLLQFEDRLHPAVAHVFGGCLVARDLECARIIAFDKRVSVRCVTLEGDVFDPEGTLVGGSKPTVRRILQNAAHLTNLKVEMERLHRQLGELENRSRGMMESRRRWDSLLQKAAGLTRERDELEASLSRDNGVILQQRLRETDVELVQLNQEKIQTEKNIAAAVKKAADARNNLDNAASVRETATKEAQEGLEAAQKEVESTEAQFADVAARYEELESDVVAAAQFGTELENGVTEKRAEADRLAETARAETLRVEERTSSVHELERDLSEKKREAAALNSMIEAERAGVADLCLEKDRAVVRLEALTHDMECLLTNSKDADHKLDKMQRKYAWIPEEKRNFGVRNTIYDFENRSRREIDTKIGELDTQKQKLSRKVDLRGMNMLAPTEVKYNELIAHYKKVLKDKSTLQDTIRDLDKQKDEVIKKAHIQVDKDFNSIFSTLLPGSEARLVPPENGDVKSGLEFRIAFGGVWKESLQELSGGQRSLVALSLILALLRFRPAPLYILDEVDAALDISHTQNIGTIIREQFENSQFIIVSLKDGMFNNANVLFKTKFVDGLSTVSRQVNTSRRNT